MRILVVRYGSIGDTVIISPFLRELRNNYPDAQIDVIANKTNHDMYTDCPYINGIITLKHKYINYLKMYRTMKKYDKIYLFVWTPKPWAQLAFCAGIKERIGFDINNKRYLTKCFSHNVKVNEVETNLNILKSEKLNIQSNKTEVWINEVNNIRAKSFINTLKDYKEQKVVTIHLTGGFYIKSWPDENWAKLIKYLSNKLDAKIIMTGHDKDTFNYIKIANMAKTEALTGNTPSPPVIGAGHFTIQESMAIVKNSDLVIGVDTGIMHVAGALDVPSIVIFGPSSYTMWKPYSDKCKVVTAGLKCVPCNKSFEERPCRNEFPHNSKCMASVTVEDVINAVHEQLNIVKA